MNECIDQIKRNVETKSRILLEQISDCLDKEEKVEKIFNALYQCHKEIEKCYAEIADKEAIIKELHDYKHKHDLQLQKCYGSKIVKL